MGIIEASQLPSEEKVYLKKDWFGWRVVHPIRNEDSSLNWFNFIFGSKSNLAFLIIIILLAGVFYLGINELIDNYKLIADEPCKFCKDCHEICRGIIRNISYKVTTINFSSIKI